MTQDTLDPRQRNPRDLAADRHGWALALVMLLAPQIALAQLECKQEADWALTNPGVKGAAPQGVPARFANDEALKPLLTSAPRAALQALIAGRYADVEAYFLDLQGRLPIGQQVDELHQFHLQLEDLKLLPLDSVLGWRKAHPKSRAARWAHGVMVSLAGWDARGEKLASETQPAAFARMQERFVAADGIFTLLFSAPDAFAAHAALKMAQMRIARGEPQPAEELFREALRLAQRSRSIHRIHMHFASEKWMGKNALSAAKERFERAQHAGLDGRFMTQLRHIREANQQRPDESPDPPFRKRFWAQRANELPSIYNLQHLAWAEEYVQDWGSLIETAERMVQVDARSKIARELRGAARQSLGQNEGAVQDHLAAVALGSERAMIALIHAQLTGALGLKRRDVPALLELCRFGASQGLPSAANCLGGLYDEAQGMPRDMEQSLAWHLLGARGGHWNSQHDLGWMAYTGSRGFKHEDMGVYWLRRAAQQGHDYAKRKLAQQARLPEAPAECKDAIRKPVIDYLETALRMVRSLRAPE